MLWRVVFLVAASVAVSPLYNRVFLEYHSPNAHSANSIDMYKNYVGKRFMK
jgi:hypothetical protein